MAGDCGGAGDAGQVGFGIDARALLQFGGAGAHHDDVAGVQAGNVDTADGAAGRGVTLQRACQVGDSLTLGRQLRQLVALEGRGRGAFNALERSAQLVLL
jgi:hypothetical protein